MAGSGIRINLFGEFSILKDGKPILTYLSNTRKTKLFMAYLLVNRDRSVPHKDLFELLWSGEEYSNPGTALRTLLYRLRGMLDKEGINNAVISKKGTYHWNPNLNISIDIIEFEEYALKGLNKSDLTINRTDNLKKALEIYKGNLLPDFNSEPWMISKAAYYREIYESVVKEYIEILKDNDDLEAVKSIAENALVLLGTSEIIALERDMAEASLNKDEACLNNTKDYYLKIHDLSANLHENALRMQEDIENDAFEQKALICDYETFKAIYKLQRRMLLRTKQTLFLGFVNVHCDGERDEKKCQKIMDNVLKLCSCQLRCADTVCKKDKNNFAILFPADSYEDAVGVLERIKNIVIEEYNKLIVVYQLRTLKNTKE